MPAFIFLIPVDFHKLLQYGVRATNALDGESGGVVEMTI
jgi:hypothetical protein